MLHVSSETLVYFLYGSSAEPYLASIHRQPVDRHVPTIFQKKSLFLSSLPPPPITRIDEIVTGRIPSRLRFFMLRVVFEKYEQNENIQHADDSLHSAEKPRNVCAN